MTVDIIYCFLLGSMAVSSLVCAIYGIKKYYAILKIREDLGDLKINKF